MFKGKEGEKGGGVRGQRLWRVKEERGAICKKRGKGRRRRERGRGSCSDMGVTEEAVLWGLEEKRKGQKNLKESSISNISKQSGFIYLCKQTMPGC